MDSITATELTLSYMRRKQFEAQQIAVQVGKLFGGASEQASRMSGSAAYAGSDPLRPGRTTGEAMMRSLGFNPKSGRNKVKH